MSSYLFPLLMCANIELSDTTARKRYRDRARTSERPIRKDRDQTTHLFAGIVYLKYYKIL